MWNKKSKMLSIPAYVRLSIQTTTWLACKVYMDLGFLPVEQNLKHNYEGWQIIKALTKHNALQTI